MRRSVLIANVSVNNYLADMPFPYWPPYMLSNCKLSWIIMSAMHVRCIKEKNQSVGNEGRVSWIEVINLIQTSDILCELLWHKDKQEKSGNPECWSCQSSMYRSVIFNSLLESRRTEPDNTGQISGYTVTSQRQERGATEGNERAEQDRKRRQRWSC